MSAGGKASEEKGRGRKEERGKEEKRKRGRGVSALCAPSAP
jgi:hypothetical protein